MPKSIPIPKGGVAYTPPEQQDAPAAETEAGDKPKRQPSARTLRRREFLQKQAEEWDEAHKDDAKALPKKIAELSIDKQIEALESMIRNHLSAVDRAKVWVDELKGKKASEAAA